MRVQIDEPGRQDEAAGIDCPARRAGDPANLDDAPTLYGNVAAPSKYSPTGYLIPTCFADALVTGQVPVLIGNLARNAGTKPYTVFNDLRIARMFKLGEHLQLQGIMDLFNVVNRYNVADVNPLWNQAGVPTAAYDPRQFQFALRLSW